MNKSMKKLLDAVCAQHVFSLLKNQNQDYI